MHHLVLLVLPFVPSHRYEVSLSVIRCFQLSFGTTLFYADQGFPGTCMTQVFPYSYMTREVDEEQPSACSRVIDCIFAEFEYGKMCFLSGLGYRYTYPRSWDQYPASVLLSYIKYALVDDYLIYPNARCISGYDSLHPKASQGIQEEEIDVSHVATNRHFTTTVWDMRRNANSIISKLRPYDVVHLRESQWDMHL